MRKFLIRWIFVLATVWLGLLGYGNAADLLEKVIQPSKEYEQIVDFWNNKDAVWNEIFREWTSVNTQASLDCYKVKQWLDDAGSCNSWWWSRHIIENKCYEKIPSPVQWNNLQEKANNCRDVAWGERVFIAGIELAQKQPLIVRVTTWLLRITVVLSVTMLIFIGIKC